MPRKIIKHEILILEIDYLKIIVDLKVKSRDD